MEEKKVVRLVFAALFGMMAFALTSAIMNDRGAGAAAGVAGAIFTYYLTGKK